MVFHNGLRSYAMIFLAWTLLVTPANRAPAQTLGEQGGDAPQWSRWRIGEPNNHAVTVRSPADLKRVLSGTNRDVLIPAGVHWEIREPLVIPAHRGGSAERPRRIVAVGNGSRPEITCQGCDFLKIEGAGHLGLAGIAAIASRDGKEDERGIIIRGRGAGNILIEDMLIHGFKDNLVIVAEKGSLFTDVVINRCILREPWHIGGSHAQNIFFNRVDRWQILDTVLYHAGWQPNHPEQRTRFNHNLYIDLDEGDPITHGEMRGVYTGYASSHAFQIRSTATVTDTIAERSAYLGSIYGGGTVERYVGMFADHIPAEDKNWTGIGLEVGNLMGTARIHDTVLAHRESGGRKVAINCAAEHELSNIRILGPWTTNNYGPILAGGRRFAVNNGQSVFYSEDPLRFRDSTARIDERLLENWLTRPRREWDDEKSPAAACALLLKAYTPRDR
ncbi:MAG: hypothetical protein AAGC44_10375 [Planctomycetota bacterium]